MNDPERQTRKELSHVFDDLVVAETFVASLQREGAPEWLIDGIEKEDTQRALGWTDQERYVDRDSCTWATVKGIRGEMTMLGFSANGTSN